MPKMLFAAILLATPATGSAANGAGNWTVTSAREADGGISVTLMRQSGPLRPALELSFWRGNNGPLGRVVVRRAGRICSVEAINPARADMVSSARLRRALDRGLTTCGAGEHARFAALAGVDGVHARWLAAARDAERRTDDERRRVAAGMPAG